MLKQSLACLLIATAAASSHADNCDSIRDQVESRFKAGGTVNFAVKIVEAGAVGSARVVGTCGMGTRRIIFVPGSPAGASATTNPGATPAPAAPPAAQVRAPSASEPAILTECKDGTVSYTGNCGK